MVDFSAEVTPSLFGQQLEALVIFVPGRVAPIAGSKASIEQVFDDAASPLENEGSIWAGLVQVRMGINKRFTVADGQSGSPCAALMVRAENAGSPGDICGMIVDGVASADNARSFGLNVIARSTGGANITTNGLEVDLLRHASDTGTISGIGLPINVFNKALTGPAIQTGGINGGSFANGIILGGIAPAGTGLSLLGGANANSLTDSGSGVYTSAAHILSNTHRIRFNGTLTAHAFLYNDAGNNLRIVGGSAGTSFRNNADTVTLATLIDDPAAGFFDLPSSSGQYRINGTKVIGARRTGWTAATGTPARGAFAAAAAGTASAGYVQAEAQGALTRIAALEARLIALEADARAHGQIDG